MTTRSVRLLTSYGTVTDTLRPGGENAESMAELDACMAGHLAIIRPNSQEDDLPSAYKGKERVEFQENCYKLASCLRGDLERPCV
jgi:hypothetical protein